MNDVTESFSGSRKNDFVVLDNLQIIVTRTE